MNAPTTQEWARTLADALLRNRRDAMNVIGDKYTSVIRDLSIQLQACATRRGTNTFEAMKRMAPAVHGTSQLCLYAAFVETVAPGGERHELVQALLKAKGVPSGTQRGHTYIAFIGALAALAIAAAALQRLPSSTSAITAPVAPQTALQATELPALDHDHGEAVVRAFRAGYQAAIERERCANGGIPNLSMPIALTREKP